MGKVIKIATTKIWDVKDSLKRVLDYASNPDKTEGNDDGLGDVIAYTSQEIKTDKQLYVTGVNCSFDTALDDMKITKKQWGKEDGILAFHLVQSFKPGEVTPEMAHQIGIELAQAIGTDRFEVLVSTHLDKAHIHNHIVINSVSFKDGYRYYDNKESYRKLREKSDQLCRRYGLSVIEEPKSKGKHYSEWNAEKHHEPTIRSMVREDVDYAISQSRSMKQFYAVLYSMGYKLKHGKHIAALPPGGKKYIRLRSLSNDGYYTEDEIQRRVNQNRPVKQVIYPSKKYVFKGDLSKQRKITGFRALYISYMYAMGVIPKQAPANKRVSFLLKEDLRYMDQITKEVTLLGKNHINTIEDLDVAQEEAQDKLDGYIKERRCIYNKIRRCKDPELKEKHQIDIEDLSKEIKELREEINCYESIRKRSVSMKEKMEEAKKLEEQRKEDEQWTMEDKQPIR